MRALTTLLVFIVLTALDGSPMWVESDDIQIIRPARLKQAQCEKSAGSGIRVGANGMCVRETPEQILELIHASQPSRH